ncbi:MAG: methionine--tRNA ligase subunit beta [Acidobacteria bacterium]|nr:methionine--tRNA ligase subunit beta [Acidobacteriota bacterium]
MSDEVAVIEFPTFLQVDLRVAKIMTCERVPKSKKLLRMDVDLGFETRQILAGLAPWYLPEEMVGRRVVVVANLAPAKLMGLESNGMVLAATGANEGAVPVLVTVPEGTPLGAKVS